MWKNHLVDTCATVYNTIEGCTWYA
ncbi:protein of unknown function [Cyanobium sp. NIES-981]|nr:protein of unknown function [Cyanobium sp. NIES-981]